MKNKTALLLLVFLPIFLFSAVLEVGASKSFRTIKQALSAAKSGDSIIVQPGIYREGTMDLEKPVTLIGVGRPVIDGQLNGEIFTFRSDWIVLKGFKIINSGRDEIRSVAAVHIYSTSNSVIENNIFENNYFGIYVQRGYRILINNNKITSSRSISQEGSGDGIHLLGSRDIWVKNNYISGHKDGIYLEKNLRCYVYHNLSRDNLRYGLHFMFSNDSVYTSNVFDNNGAGVAVMYAMNVSMYNNRFINNWGDGVYGLLLKEISYSKIQNNSFEGNTTGIFADGATKIDFYNNSFANNGWALKINANCMENRIFRNNFVNNTFDVSTNGSVVMNEFRHNYWDKYEGYDLDKDKKGDIPFHPLSLYSVLVEQNPSVMLLFRSFLIDMLDRTEKIIPSLTPESFVDEQPAMKPFKT